jgi:hypothetical protein
MRARGLLAIALTTSSCAIVANLGDRTLGDLFPDGGGPDATDTDGTTPDGGPGPGDDGSPGNDVISPPFDAPPGCVVDNFPAPLAEVQIYLAVDTSASLTEVLPAGGTRFENERTAVTTFVHEPLSASLNVTMGMHPGATDAGCDPAPYAAPPIPLGKLGAGTADAIANALTPITPNGQSPWSAMITGALQRLATLKQQAPDKVTALVFIADSTPTACDLTAAGIVAIVGPPAQASPPIRTFTMGITLMTQDVTTYFDPIAKAGGTDAGYATVPPSAATMQAALEAIRDDIACNVLLPQVGGKVVDLTKSVLFVRTPNNPDVTIASVANAAACAAADAYYPAPTPDRVHLCPHACARLLGDATAKSYVAACK